MNIHKFQFDRTEFQRQSIAREIMHFNYALCAIMIDDQEKDSSKDFSNGFPDPFDSLHPLAGTSSKMLDTYTPVGLNIEKAEKDGLMVWGTGKGGERKLQYLQDYLFDLRINRLEKMSREELVNRENDELTVGNEAMEDTMQALKAGNVVFFPSSTAKQPKVVQYQEETRNIVVTDLNKEKMASQKPWFAGLGLFTKFVTYVSDSARIKMETYEQGLKLREFYTNPETEAEIKRVADQNAHLPGAEASNSAENRREKAISYEKLVRRKEHEKQIIKQEDQDKKMTALFSMEGSSLDTVSNLFHPEKTIMMPVKEPRVDGNALNDLQIAKDDLENLRLDYEILVKPEPEIVQKTSAKIHDIPSQKLESSKIDPKDMETINLCCTLAVPFNEKSEAYQSMQAEKLDIKENILYTTNHIFRNMLSNDDQRDIFVGRKLYGEKDGFDLVKYGRDSAEKAVTKFEKGVSAPLAKRIKVGLDAMQYMLQSTLLIEYDDPKSHCQVVAKSIAKTMDFLDKHPELAEQVKLSQKDRDICNGWREFHKITEEAQKEKNNLLNDAFDAVTAQDALAMDLNLKRVCCDYMKTKSGILRLGEPSNLWESGLDRSKVIMRNPSIPIIEALGKDPGRIKEILKAAPEHGLEKVYKEKVRGDILSEFSSSLTDLEIHKGPKSLCKMSVEQLVPPVQQVKSAPKIEVAQAEKAFGRER